MNRLATAAPPRPPRPRWRAAARSRSQAAPRQRPGATAAPPRPIIPASAVSHAQPRVGEPRTTPPLVDQPPRGQSRSAHGHAELARQVGRSRSAPRFIAAFARRLPQPADRPRPRKPDATRRVPRSDGRRRPSGPAGRTGGGPGRSSTNSPPADEADPDAHWPWTFATPACAASSPAVQARPSKQAPGHIAARVSSASRFRQARPGRRAFGGHAPILPRRTVRPAPKPSPGPSVGDMRNRTRRPRWPNPSVSRTHRRRPGRRDRHRLVAFRPLSRFFCKRPPHAWPRAAGLGGGAARPAIDPGELRGSLRRGIRFGRAGRGARGRGRRQRNDVQGWRAAGVP